MVCFIDRSSSWCTSVSSLDPFRFLSLIKKICAVMLSFKVFLTPRCSVSAVSYSLLFRLTGAQSQKSSITFTVFCNSHLNGAFRPLTAEQRPLANESWAPEENQLTLNVRILKSSLCNIDTFAFVSSLNSNSGRAHVPFTADAFSQRQVLNSWCQDRFIYTTFNDTYSLWGPHREQSSNMWPAFSDFVVVQCFSSVWV